MSDLENNENIIIVHSEEDLDLLRDTKHSIDEPNRVEWSHEATKELLKIYDEKVDMLDTGIISTHKKIWELTSRLLAKKGFYYNSTQCENKWKALKRAYRNKLDRVAKFSSYSYKRFSPFESEVSEILSKRPNDNRSKLYSIKIHTMKKDDDLFDNINLNEPPGYEQNVESKKIKLKDNMGPEDQVDFGQPQFTISDQDASQNVLAEKLADLEKIIAKQGRINTQVLAETNEVQARLVECLEETVQLKNRALEIEERKVEQQGEVIEQMKLQNELLHSILGKLK